MRSPRSSRSSAWVSLRRSTPSKRISPPAMRPGGCGTNPMIDSAVTLLPQPDSPTMPSVRPAAIEKLTPSTAGNSPLSTVKNVLRFRTSSSTGFNAARAPSLSAQAMHARRMEAQDLRLDRSAVGDARGTRAAGKARDEGLVALETLDVQAPKFVERLGMVVHAQIQERIRLGR